MAKVITRAPHNVRCSYSGRQLVTVCNTILSLLAFAFVICEDGYGCVGEGAVVTCVAWQMQFKWFKMIVSPNRAQYRSGNARENKSYF